MEKLLLVKSTGYGFRNINGKKFSGYYHDPAHNQVVQFSSVGGLDIYNGLWNVFSVPVRVSNKPTKNGWFKIYRVW